MSNLDSPVKWVDNMDMAGGWTKASPSANPDILPDRTAPFIGKNNYRGAQIKSLQQMQLLKKKGIKHILSLSGDSYSQQKCDGQSDPCEKMWAQDLGMTWTKVHLGSRPPNDADWQMIREMLAKGGVFVHCTSGVDRTGAIVARFRKEVEPEMTDKAVLNDYTYKFGGAWRNAADSNRYLRAWVQDGKFDPELRKEIRPQSYPCGSHCRLNLWCITAWVSCIPVEKKLMWKKIAIISGSAGTGFFVARTRTESLPVQIGGAALGAGLGYIIDMFLFLEDSDAP